MGFSVPTDLYENYFFFDSGPGRALGLVFTEVRAHHDVGPASNDTLRGEAWAAHVDFRLLLGVGSGGPWEKCWKSCIAEVMYKSDRKQFRASAGYIAVAAPQLN